MLFFINSCRFREYFDPPEVICTPPSPLLINFSKNFGLPSNWYPRTPICLAVESIRRCPGYEESAPEGINMDIFWDYSDPPKVICTPLFIDFQKISDPPAYLAPPLLFGSQE